MFMYETSLLSREVSQQRPELSIAENPGVAALDIRVFPDTSLIHPERNQQRVRALPDALTWFVVPL